MLAAVLLLPGAALGDPTYPARPAERGFLADEAGLVAGEDAEAIRALADRLLTDAKVPILVATVASIGSHGAGDWTIERYARNLFDEWGVGFPDRNDGILLLVSAGDRKARIELGDGWQRAVDDRCREIMDGEIIPAFKRKDFSGGIRAGVEALERMVREERQIPASGPLPQGPARPRARSNRDLLVYFILFAVVVAGAASFAMSGTNSWAWIGGSGLLAAIGMILLGLLSIPAWLNRRPLDRVDEWEAAHRGGRGGWGGGSFGGGFGGGGGATGSW